MSRRIAPRTGKEREEYMLRYPPELRGDGRVQIHPGGVQLPGMRPQPMSRSQARAQIDRFEPFGESTHSVCGATVWVLIGYLDWREESYEIVKVRSGGWHVRRYTEHQ